MCKWFDGFDCTISNNRVVVETWNGRHREYIKEPWDKNKNNDCVDYKMDRVQRILEFIFGVK
jgi:hypothetical protein